MGDRGIIFCEGKDGNRQRQRYQELLTQEVYSTRYIDDNCLYSLGIYHCVYYLLENLGLEHLFDHRENTYMNLTMEYLSSLIYNVSPNTTSTVCTVKFRMFNMEYAYITDQLEGLLGFPHGEGVLCETPLDTDWAIKAYQF